MLHFWSVKVSIVDFDFLLRILKFMSSSHTHTHRRRERETRTRCCKCQQSAGKSSESLMSCRCRCHRIYRCSCIYRCCCRCRCFEASPGAAVCGAPRQATQVACIIIKSHSTLSCLSASISQSNIAVWADQANLLVFSMLRLPKQQKTKNKTKMRNEAKENLIARFPIALTHFRLEVNMFANRTKLDTY